VKPLLFHHKAVDTNSGKVPDETIAKWQITLQITLKQSEHTSVKCSLFCFI